MWAPPVCALCLFFIFRAGRLVGGNCPSLTRVAAAGTAAHPCRCLSPFCLLPHGPWCLPALPACSACLSVLSARSAAERRYTSVHFLSFLLCRSSAFHNARYVYESVCLLLQSDRCPARTGCCPCWLPLLLLVCCSTYLAHTPLRSILLRLAAPYAEGGGRNPPLPRKKRKEKKKKKKERKIPRRSLTCTSASGRAWCRMLCHATVGFFSCTCAFRQTRSHRLRLASVATLVCRFAVASGPGPAGADTMRRDRRPCCSGSTRVGGI